MVKQMLVRGGNCVRMNMSKYVVLASVFLAVC